MINGYEFCQYVAWTIWRVGQVSQPESGKCVLGASKAPSSFCNADHLKCHLDVWEDYIDDYLAALKSLNPEEQCVAAYYRYCRRAEECDKIHCV